jgi:solute:Na+ symporter, SSS family
VFGLYTRRFHPNALLVGWAVGMVLGTGLSWSQGVKPVFPVPGIGTVYIGLIALLANIIVTALGTWIASLTRAAGGSDVTTPADYEDAVA